VSLKVLVADDQELVRAGFTMILNAQADLDVVAQAKDGREAVELARRVRPDVCLFDVRMPGMDGIEATQRLAGPGVADPMNVVVVTTFDLDEYVLGALRAGAKGFILKDAGPVLLVEAIHAAANGDSLISPRVTTRLIRQFTSGRTRAEPRERLTRREEEILAAVAQGLTNQELSEQLFTSLSTVKTHLANLMTKLGVRNRVELVIWWYESGRAGRGGRSES
jgi:DNA-binding NarL/FixJ family response regulator